MVTIQDASGYTGQAEALFAPASAGELAEILREASSRRIPVTAVGSRTGVAGGCVPHEGWAVSTDRLKKLQIRRGSALAGAGVALRDLQAEASRTGQFYAPDPTEHTASVGGSIATNASGSRSFRYGDTRRHVVGLQVALMDGSVLELRRGQPVPFPLPDVPLPATTKFSAGFPLRPGMDYLDLFIGSEGVLGIVTEAELQLLPTPAELLSGVVFFKADAQALAAVDAWRGIVGLRMLEYMDRGSLRMLRPRFPDIPSDAGACLLIEQEVTSEADVDVWLDRLETAAALAEASWFGVAAADRERFRVFRHALPEAVNETVRLRGLTKMGTDFAVPVSRSAEMMSAYRELLDAEFPGRYVIFGHIGDAHVHANILPRDKADAARASQIIAQLAAKAVSLGGTVAAEHGLGKRKAHLLSLQWPAEVIAAMETVKKMLDPHCLLGRSTLFIS